MPQFGGGTLSSAALRNYALTLNAGLAPHSVYAGTITIGGLIESSDIHKANTAAGGAIPTLNPDDLAEELRQLYTTHDKAEAVVPPIG
ncbi:hypothetical protein [Mycolicibacter kumamotonensis]|jgi:hypothetical protein|uniref:Uncharacterized protein n=1 Tax=Mycolicibacter kumamotonensis TaxID=354243 RepID=A0A7K3LH30_9MYCO|nr:hypothetical protein [Mycolicibacter kumamotonensis]NDJ91658.1 hypothetical protein [Mycolicibacter kumamotonensis]